MHPNLQDTIVAVSSAPPGASCGSARAILRLSGPDSFPMARQLFSPHAAGPAWPVNGAPDRRVGWQRIAGTLRWRECHLPACAYLMPGPRSYTRQDVVEIHLPCLEAVLEDTLAALRDAGVRLAAPGEFTRRALLLGRVSLAQADAIGALIRATTADEARAWAAQVGAADRAAPGTLRDEVQDLLTHLELGLDFSLEDVTFLPRKDLERRLASLVQRLSQADQPDHEITSKLAWGGAPRIVLVGATGAGKSTLLNALLGRNAALVSSSEHTTRDPVEALHEWSPGVSARFSDTAGLGLPEASPLLARQAMDLTSRAANSADVLLLVLDRTTRKPGDMERLAGLLRSARPASTVLVWTKSDLQGRLTPAEEARTETELAQAMGVTTLASFGVAASTGVGIRALLAHLTEVVRGLQSRLSAAWASGLATQRSSSRAALAALQRALHALQNGLGEDAIAVELREAAHALSDAQGILLRHDALTESLLDRIFNQFCMGK